MGATKALVFAKPLSLVFRDGMLDFETLKINILFMSIGVYNRCMSGVATSYTQNRAPVPL